MLGVPRRHASRFWRLIVAFLAIARHGEQTAEPIRVRYGLAQSAHTPATSSWAPSRRRL
jgi:hypothetical protein